VTNEICVTLDVDWACDEIIEYSINLLKEYKVKATIFATHESELLRSLKQETFEIGIHPNFLESADHEKTVDNLLQIYPNAVGVRCHGCFQSTSVFRLFISRELKYDCSTYVPLVENLRPWIRLKELVCIPFYWCDDTLFYSGLPFDLSQLHVSKNGLKVYLFHPIHIFTNTQSEEHYRRFKPFYHEPNKLIGSRGKNEGTTTMFIQLLDYIHEKRISYTCREIYQRYLRRKKNEE